MEPVHETYPDSQPRHPESHILDARKLFLLHLDFITTTATCTCRRSRLPDEDTKDFCSWVILRLMSRNFRILRSCRDSSALRSFLRTTIKGLLNDYRNHLWGKWRPSKEAKRLGPTAVDLERLWRRDGYSLSEAIELLCHNSPRGLERAELEEFARRLPWRLPSRKGPDAPLEEVNMPAMIRQQEDDVDLRRLQHSAQRVLREAMAKLPRLDRQILHLHYYKGETIAAVARRLGIQQRKLYSLRDRSLLQLKRELQSNGVRWNDIVPTIGWDPRAESRSPDGRRVLQTRPPLG